MRRNLWRFRQTGRIAEVIEVISKGDRDDVMFRFDGDRARRSIPVPKFLSDFDRVRKGTRT